MDDQKPKPIPLKDILAEKKETPKTPGGRIPVPVGVGRGMGQEIRDMYKRRNGIDNDEIDD